MNLTDFESEAS